MSFPCHLNVFFSSSLQTSLFGLTYMTWHHACSLLCNIQGILRASLRTKRIPPIIFQETSLLFPTHHARRNPVFEAAVPTRRDLTKPWAAWWHQGTAHPHSAPGPELDVLQGRGITTKICQLLSPSPSNIQSFPHFFSFCCLCTKLSLTLKSLPTFTSLGGIRDAPSSSGKQRPRSQLGQDILQDETFWNPIHWIDAVADTMLGTHVKIEMLLKMFNLVRQISKNLCKTI